MDIITDIIKKSNKKHICNYCGLPIEYATTYVYQTIFDNGTVYNWKSHVECHELVTKSHLFDDWIDDGIGMSEFHDTVQEYYNMIVRDVDKRSDSFEEQMKVVQNTKFETVNYPFELGGSYLKPITIDDNAN